MTPQRAPSDDLVLVKVECMLYRLCIWFDQPIQLVIGALRDLLQINKSIKVDMLNVIMRVI
jgi:hypothetical protein